MSEAGRRSARIQQQAYQLGLQQPATLPVPLPHHASTLPMVPVSSVLNSRQHAKRTAQRPKTLAQLESSGIHIEELTQAATNLQIYYDVSDDACDVWDDETGGYSGDIQRCLRSNEMRLFREKDVARFTTIQREITPQMRTILVDWLVEVGEEYKLQQKTLLLTINYVDRYLSKIPVSKYSLQLLGVACMLIASKCEEIYPPLVDDFVYISDNTYQKPEILRMEQEVLNCLSFNMCAATYSDFLAGFIKAAGFEHDRPVRVLCDYLAELTLVELQFWKFIPSQLCAAIVRLALHTLNRPFSKVFEFESYTRYSRAQLEEPLVCLLTWFQKSKVSAQNVTRGIFNKFMHNKNMKVATVDPPATLPA